METSLTQVSQIHKVFAMTNHLSLAVPKPESTPNVSSTVDVEEQALALPPTTMQTTTPMPTICRFLPVAVFHRDDRYDEIKRGDIHIAELQRMTMQQLMAQARRSKSPNTPAEEAGSDL